MLTLTLFLGSLFGRATILAWDNDWSARCRLNPHECYLGFDVLATFSLTHHFLPGSWQLATISHYNVCQCHQPRGVVMVSPSGRSDTWLTDRTFVGVAHVS